MLSGPVFLPPHQFVTAAVLDCAVAAAWLLAILFPPKIGVRRVLYAFLLALSLAAIWYTPRHHVPAYAPLPKSSDTAPVSVVLSMHEGSVSKPWAIVDRDVLAAETGSRWTWTGAQPHFRFLIEDAQRWEFELRFATAGQVIRTVGAQSIEVRINGVPVHRIAASEIREYRVRVPVDPARFRMGAMNDVELNIEPTYLSADGVRLGVLLQSIGFVEGRN